MPRKHSTPGHPIARDEARWQAVLAKDAAADGTFYFAVTTTGIYCRPSCPARPAKRSNVTFYESAAAARAAGFRPCQRCRPDDASHRERQVRMVSEACRRIETAEDEPSLRELAAVAQLSAHHFHRIFKSITGVTPKAYAQAKRRSRLHEQLRGSKTVTEAILDSGFNSSGRFYASARSDLGMTPTAYRAGGANTELRFAVGPCSLGRILVAASGKGVAAIFFGDDAEALTRELQERFPRAHLISGDGAFAELLARVIACVEAPEANWELPLDVRGTAFQQRVWQALRQVPVGETVTYAEIARRIGAPKAVRAVGAACGANRLAVAIPCHRVVRADGDVSGYRWRVERKRELLRREAAARRARKTQPM